MSGYLLITGGCGYIGSYVTALFKARNYPIVVIDNLSTGWKSNMLEGVHYEIGDIGDAIFLHQVFSKYPIETVMHLAAKTSVEESMLKPEYYYEENSLKTIHLINICAMHSVQHFFFSSTAAVYAEHSERPFKEDDATYPSSIYGKSKYLAELSVQRLAQSYGIQCIIFRYFNVAGHVPSMLIGNYHPHPATLIPKICRNIAKHHYVVSVNGNDYNTQDGTCVRDYVHVLDIAHAHLLFFTNIRFLGLREDLIVNIGYGYGLSVLEVIQIINTFLEDTPLRYMIGKRRLNDLPYAVADCSKIKSFDWKSVFDEPHKAIIESELEWSRNMVEYS